MASQPPFTPRRRHDVIVIGGGSAGYAAARVARGAGAATLLSDMDEDIGRTLEAALREVGIDTIAGACIEQVTTATYPFADHGKTMCLGAPRGFVKLICEPVVGPDAAELIPR